MASNDPLATSGAGARAAATPGDLDSKIRAAEQALIERDARIRRDAGELARRLHLGGSGGGSSGSGTRGFALGGGAAGLVRSLFSGGGSSGGITSETGKHAAGGAAAAGMSALMRLMGKRGTPRWAPLLALAWPMAPRALRSRIGPATATALLGVALPLLAHSKRSKAQDKDEAHPVLPAPRVDLRRFTGRWFEIARFPASFERGCNREVMAHYTLEGKRLRVINRCSQRNGKVKVASGVGRIVRGGNGARLKISFAPHWLRWLPGTWSPFWILRIDPDYRAALVGTPDRKYLWLLSRTRYMSDAQYTQLVDYARQQGFDVSRLRLTPQAG